MTKFNLAFPSKNQRQLLSKYLIAISITFLFFLSIPISSHAACTSVTSTAAEHVSNSRAASITETGCSSCSDSSCCQSYGASGYQSFYKHCYSGNIFTEHSCMSATPTTTYTSTGGNPISDSGDVTLYQGSNGNWYTTDPEDCDAAPPPPPPPPLHPLHLH